MSKKLEPIVLRSLEDWKRHCEQIQNSTAVNQFETKGDQEKRKTRAKRDYNFFVKTYYPKLAACDCADFHVEAANAILKHPKRISVLEWPREHAKSVHADIIIPMWLLIHDELTGMIIMGKNQPDACNLLSDIQAELQFNQLFAHDWGDQYNFGDWREGDFTTKSGIRFFAVGRDQSPRGARKGEKRPNYGVVDDVDDDEIVNNQVRVKKIVKRILGALLFALATKKWRLVVAGNRIGSGSILAHIVGNNKPGAPKRKGIFHSFVVAAYNKITGKPATIPLNPETDVPAWKENYTIEDLNAKIDAAGPTEANRELFHKNNVEGTIFKDERIVWKKMPKVNWRHYRAIIGYCDPSFEDNATSDFKAVRIWGLWGEEKHCLKSFVQRIELIPVFQFMSWFEDKLPPGVAVIWYIEKQFFNKQIRQALEMHNKQRRKDGKPELMLTIDDRDKPNKYTRIVRMEPTYYTSGSVYYNIDEIHDADMVEGNNQLKGIEPGYKGADDSPDADEGAWYYLDQMLQGAQMDPRIGHRNRNATDGQGYITKEDKRKW